MEWQAAGREIPSWSEGWQLCCVRSGTEVMKQPAAGTTALYRHLQYSQIKYNVKRSHAKRVVEKSGGDLTDPRPSASGKLPLTKRTIGGEAASSAAAGLPLVKYRRRMLERWDKYNHVIRFSLGRQPMLGAVKSFFEGREKDWNGTPDPARAGEAPKYSTLNA